MTAAVRLLALSGCRPGEIINLKWSEIDQASRCLRLHDLKEGASTRPLGKPALEVLARSKAQAMTLSSPLSDAGGELSAAWPGDGAAS